MSKRPTADFYATVNERRAVKHYDTTHQLSKQDITELLDIANCAPSSWNLQHWKFLAITDPKDKERLLPIAYGQQQVVDASVVVAVLGDLQANSNADAVYEPAVQAGLMPADVKSAIMEQIEFAYANDPNFPRDEAIRNASLAAMQLMLATKAKGLDSCPMGGYDADALVKAFGIPERYIPVVLIAIGKAAVPARPSGRFKVSESIIWNGY
jgi:nitroreductase